MMLWCSWTTSVLQNYWISHIRQGLKCSFWAFAPEDLAEEKTSQKVWHHTLTDLTPYWGSSNVYIVRRHRLVKLFNFPQKWTYTTMQMCSFYRTLIIESEVKHNIWCEIKSNSISLYIWPAPSGITLSAWAVKQKASRLSEVSHVRAHLFHSVRKCSPQVPGRSTSAVLLGPAPPQVDVLTMLVWRVGIITLPNLEMRKCCVPLANCKMSQTVLPLWQYFTLF